MFIAVVQKGHELKLQRDLWMNYGLVAYVPLRWSKTQTKVGLKQYLKPCLNRYLYIEDMDSEQVKGVFKQLRYDDYAICYLMKNSHGELIHMSLDELMASCPDDTISQFKEGDRVKLIEETFQGIVGVIVNIHEQNAEVQIDLMVGAGKYNVLVDLNNLELVR